MSCVICCHLRCTLALAAGATSKAQAFLHENYDVTNNAAAVAFLLDLLAPALTEIISEKLEQRDSFHVAWLELMSKIQVQTVKRT